MAKRSVNKQIVSTKSPSGRVMACSQRPGGIGEEV